MSEIFYAGGTAVKDISANDLINDLKQKGKNAFFVENSNEFSRMVRSHLNRQLCIAADGGERSFTGTICTTSLEGIVRSE